MKCTCKECDGTGEITCLECNGKGTYEGSISTITLEKNMENYDALLEFQKDAKRVTMQTEQLKAMNPTRSESYDAQLKATLFEIDRQVQVFQEKVGFV